MLFSALAPGTGKIKMTCNRISGVIAVALLSGTSASALAAFNPGIHGITSDPSTWAFANNIASLNAQTAGFNYQPVSGFAWEFFGSTQDRTDVITDVFRFNSAHTFNPGGGAQEFTASAGDLVFAYRITLVEANALTVTSLTEAQITGAPLFGFGVDAMDASLINAQGVVIPSHGRSPVLGNISDAGTFGSSLDFEWGGGLAQNLLNNQTIVMLMFTNPAGIGRGVVNLIAPPGQIGGLNTIVQGNDAPPVLIPTTIVPGPGAMGIAVIGLGMIASRRRRQA